MYVQEEHVVEAAGGHSGTQEGLDPDDARRKELISLWAIVGPGPQHENSRSTPKVTLFTNYL